MLSVLRTLERTTARAAADDVLRACKLFHRHLREQECIGQGPRAIGPAQPVKRPAYRNVGLSIENSTHFLCLGLHEEERTRASLPTVDHAAARRPTAFELTPRKSHDQPRDAHLITENIEQRHERVFSSPLREGE